MILLAGKTLREEPLRLAHAVAAATGARLLCGQSNARVERGRGRFAIERIPYPADQALAAFAGMKHLVLVGASPPPTFFAYPGKPGRAWPDDCQIHVLARPEQDGPDALAQLADALGAAPGASPIPEAEPPPGPARGALTSESVAQTLAALLPEDAVVVDESITFGRAFYDGMAGAPHHDWLQITGGAIGIGLPLATGAAMGAPGRRVVCLEADGSALYTVQALWTQAREQLDVTTVILSNRKYAILLGEYRGVGANPGPTALNMLDLGNPDLDWIAIAAGLGVEAARAETVETFADLFAQANARPGPFLIELVI